MLKKGKLFSSKPACYDEYFVARPSSFAMTIDEFILLVVLKLKSTLPSLQTNTHLNLFAIDAKISLLSH